MSTWGTIWRAAQLAHRALATFGWSLAANVFLRLHPAAELAGWVRVTGRVRFHLHPQGRLVLARGVRIHSGAIVNPVGGHRPSVIAVHKDAVIEVGADSGLSSVTIVAHRRIAIGRRVLVGGDTAIYDSDFHPLRAADRLVGPDHRVVSTPVEIGDGAFIGTGVTILKGVIIGADAVIGAGSVVTKPVPAGEIWAGNPARLLIRHDA
ncbi:MAG: acyltransferase [Opitutaceae bacterium]|nr:acyltransferase [Opitutaceae bacterium]